MLRVRLPVLAALLAVTLIASTAAGQSGVSPADVQRLLDNVYQAGTDISQLRSRNAARADQLQAELDELREEVIYLKVKLRKEQSVARSEYADVRDRIEDFRTRACSDAPLVSTGRPRATAAADSTPARGGAAAGMVEIPVGTELDVRLSTPLNSGTAVSFDQIAVSGRAYPLRGTVTRAIEGEGIKGESDRIATGAGVGAVIGGILGGFKSALAGILIGAGGSIVATEGRQVELPQGAILRVRIDAPVQIAY